MFRNGFMFIQSCDRLTTCAQLWTVLTHHLQSDLRKREWIYFVRDESESEEQVISKSKDVIDE